MPTGLTEVTRAPVGFRWISRPNESTFGYIAVRPSATPHTAEAAAELIKNIHNWINRHGLDEGQVRASPDYVQRVGTIGSSILFVYKYSVSLSTRPTRWLKQICRHGTEHDYGDLVCTCGGTQESLRCCDSYRLPPTGDGGWIEEEGRYGCDRCSLSCANCSRRIGATHNFTLCEDCDTRVSCNGGCGETLSLGSGFHFTAGSAHFCEDCWTRRCPDCSTVFSDPLTFVEVENAYYCAGCARARQRSQSEQIDQDDSTNDAMPLLETFAHRPVRTCSIELEAATGGATLAAQLARLGLVESSTVLPYHSSNTGICHVEADSSLGPDGGEVVLNRLRLDIPEEAAAVASVLATMRALALDGRVDINLRCGTHIHIDGHQYGVGDTRNLVLIANYLEDPIYRLGASRYTRHRGVRHAIPTAKGPYPTRREFGRVFFNTNEHHSALNVSNYWAAMRQHCRCGASVVGTHEECECNLGKCTFEFRYFNGTSNPKKLLAYLALCHSLVSYAKSVPDLDASLFSSMEYLSNDSQPASTTMLDQWEERLRWMFRHLYFSQAERAAMVYTIQHSKLSELGTARLTAICSERYVAPNAPPQEIQHKNPREVPLDRRSGAPVVGSSSANNHPPQRVFYSHPDTSTFDALYRQVVGDSQHYEDVVEESYDEDGEF